MERGDQDKGKEIPIATTLGNYNNLPINRDSSSSKLSSPILGETGNQPCETHTLKISSDQPQTSHHHHHHHLHPHQLQQPHRPRRDPDPSSSSPIATTGAATTLTPLVRYRECMKNHAASVGGHVVDGCGEFMPSGEEGTPQSLKCAACECHRNFHRKEAHQGKQISYVHNRNNIPSPLHRQQYHRFSSHGIAATSGSLIPPTTVAFGGGGVPAASSGEDLNMFQSNGAAGGQLFSVQAPVVSSSKKRFRTKFTHQQKDRMMEFAEKLGWKIQKQDEQQVQQFCSQVGVKRQVFKVWMHNNKQAIKKKM